MRRAYLAAGVDHALIGDNRVCKPGLAAGFEKRVGRGCFP